MSWISFVHCGAIRTDQVEVDSGQGSAVLRALCEDIDKVHFADYYLVGWIDERSCVYSPCIQSGICFFS